MYFDASNCQDNDLNELEAFMDNSEQTQILKKLKHSSAIVLCDDEKLRDKIANLIENIRDKESQKLLSSLPDAVLPLTIAIQTNPSCEIKSLALACLKKIINFQSELIEYPEKMPY